MYRHKAERSADLSALVKGVALGAIIGVLLALPLGAVIFLWVL